MIVAEDITSRFLNIIQLFNGTIPIIAVQMNAYEIGDKVALVFTKVVDELNLGLADEDEAVNETTDRKYWEIRGSKESVNLADKVLAIIKEINPGFEIKYNKHYIGLFKDNQASNFTVFNAKKNHLRMEIRMERSEDTEKVLDDSGLDVMEYNSRNGRYRIRLTEKEIAEKHDLIKSLLVKSYKENYDQ